MLIIKSKLLQYKYNLHKMYNNICTIYHYIYAVVRKKDYFKLQTKIDTYLPKIFSLSNKNLKQYKW